MSDRKKPTVAASNLSGEADSASRHLLSRLGSAICLSFVIVLFCSADVFAGSIFMKNGYIIQGRIVDRDANAVILGWPHGKVAIAHRFVDSVVYDPGEEERLVLLENARQEKESTDGEVEVSVLSEGADVGELPPSLEILMRKLKMDPLGSTLDEVGDGLAGDWGEEPDVVSAAADGNDPLAVEDPESALIDEAISGTTSVAIEPALGDQVSSDGLQIAIRPPEKWVNESEEEIIVFTESSEDVEGFRSSLNIVSMERGSLSAEDYVEILKAEQAETLDDFELLSEGSTAVADENAYEIVGRGAMQQQFVILRQIILVRGERVWLFSVFTTDDADSLDSSSHADQVMALTDAALESVELLEVR